MKPKAVYVVYADWCPHCISPTVEPLVEAAAGAGVGCVLLNIDTDDVGAADGLVKKYGDWTPDYLVPQVFLEHADGSMEHVLTGNPKGVELTREAVKRLIDSGVLSGSSAAETRQGPEE